MSSARFHFVAGRLAVGNIAAAFLPGWAWVVTCCSTQQVEQAGFDPEAIDSRIQTYIPFEDGEEPPPQMRLWLASARGRIRQALFQGCVLIHCGAGESRSVFVAADYLMSCLGMTTSEAIGLISRSHPSAAPAEVFRRYLGKLHEVERLAGCGPRI